MLLVWSCLVSGVDVVLRNTDRFRPSPKNVLCIETVVVGGAAVGYDLLVISSQQLHIKTLFYK